MPPETKTTTRPTLKTIAQLSGLAVPTVSRALNDAPDIGEATKARVRAIANDVGYRPDRAALHLRTGKTNVIALVLSTHDDMMNHTARLITSIAAATRGTPYHMIVTPYFADQDPMDPVRYITETRCADGIILNQTVPRDPRVEHLMQIGFPFVTHGRTNWCDTHPFYDFDNATFGRLTVQKLAERKRQSLLLVAPPRDQFYAMEMTRAIKEDVARRGLSLHILATATSDDVTTNIEQAVAEHLATEPPVDGVICASPNSAMAVVTALEGSGRKIGTDVDVIAKEAVPFLKHVRQEMLVINEDVSKAGEFVCHALMQRIDKPDLPPMQFLEQPSP